MNNEKIVKEHSNFKLYSTLVTIFIITAFMISMVAGEKTNTSSTKTDDLILDEDLELEDEVNSDEMQEAISTSTLKEDKESESSKLLHVINYSYPVKGDIILKFSPNELIYDEILEQYRVSNGITMRTNSIDLSAMCDSKILSIDKSDTSKSTVKLMTTDNHIITISGYLINFTKKEGDVILKGSKLCDINSNNEYSYIDITVTLNDAFVDPTKLINS